jgi:site-specific recombinase XerD
LAHHREFYPLEFVKTTFRPGMEETGYSRKKLSDDFISKQTGKDITSLGFFDQLDEYIISRERRVTPVMLRIYRNMKTHLQEFEIYRKRAITFDQLDLTFYEQFVEFLIHDYVQKRRKVLRTGLRINTIGKTIKEFRNFLRDRARRKIITPVDMDGWKVLEEEIDAIYLTNAEIKQIKETDLSQHPYLERYRDDLVLGCLTGLRFSDLSTVRPEDIRDSMLHVKQQKSNHWVVIPLREEAKRIMTKNYENRYPPHTNELFNKYIKIVARMAGLHQPIKLSYKKGNERIEITQPKYTWVMSHTCRRSFCTNEFLAGTPVELIMKISGHKSVKDFYKYIRISPEEAGRKIQQIWQQRELLLT